MVQTLRFLVNISRPRFWLYLAGPFLFGTVLGATTVTDLISVQFFAWFLFFLLPANLFLYGINDRYDADTDKFNKKKGTKEHLLHVREQRTLVVALAASVALYAVAFTYLAITGQTLLSALLLILLALSAGYSVPPIRFKARPVLDMLSNTLYALPGFFGYALYTGQAPSVPAIIAATCWVCAMQLYSAIPDIAADMKAKLTTTAIVLGERGSLVLCTALWLVFALIVSGAGFGVFGALAFMYVALPLIPLFIPAVSVEWLYWRFPWITGTLGLLFWWYIALQKIS